MEIPLKYKYRRPKSLGKNKSKSNDGTRRRANKTKVSDRRKLELQALQPKVTLVLLPSGKRRFVREPRG